MQSRTSSLIEACLNTASGFILSFVVWHFVAIAYGIPMSFDTNLQITGIFTVVSIVRSYLWRRLFNKREAVAA
jgi:membrane protein implicated in regulation of membrane protease activity